MNNDVLSGEVFVIAVIALAFIAIVLSGLIAYLLPKVANMVNQDFAESLANTIMLGAKELVADVLPKIEQTAQSTDNKFDDFIVEQVKHALERDGYIIAQRDDGTPAIIPNTDDEETTE